MGHFRVQGVGGLKGKILLSVLFVLALLTVSSIPIGPQRPTAHQRFETAPPLDAPWRGTGLDQIPGNTTNQTTPEVNGTWDPSTGPNHDSTKDTLDALDHPDKSTIGDVLFYVEPASEPRYWRMKAFDQFDGESWSMSSTTYETYSGLPVGTGVAGQVTGHEVTYRITYNGSTVGYLPTALYTTRLWGMVPGRSAVYRDPYGDFLTVGDKAHAYNFSAYSYDFPVTLLNASRPGSDPAMEPYLQLPSNMSGRVKALALELGAQASSPYGKALVLTSHLRDNYGYNFNAQVPPASQRDDIVDWFLFDAREGRSPEFATALAVLLRSNGIPARVAEGYALGDLVNGIRVVRNGHEHAWVELYLYGVGWLALEATGSSVSPQGATGVSSDGGDTTVQDGNGTSFGTGGGTTSTEPPGGTSNSTKVGSIALKSDRDTVWKGDLFHVYGDVKGLGNPGPMGMTIYLQSMAGFGNGNRTGDLIVAGKGQVTDGHFDVLCSPDRTRVGPNWVLAMAQGVANGTTLLAKSPGGNLSIKVKSKAAFDVNVLDTFPKDDIATVKFVLSDAGGIPNGGRPVDVTWAGNTWTVVTLEPSTVATFKVTENAGAYALALVFKGDSYLNATNWTRTIAVSDNKTVMDVTLDPPSTTVVAGDSKHVSITLQTSGGLLIHERVEISLDKTQLTSGYPNGMPMSITFPRGSVGAGNHSLHVTYTGSKEHPPASVSFDLKVLGTTKVLLGSKRVSIGESVVLSPVLEDNLNRPLEGQLLQMTWAFPSGHNGHLSAMTDEDGKADFTLDSFGETPGVANFTVTFGGTQEFTGSFTNARVTLSSPTVLMADFPARLVRQTEFVVTGRLFDFKGEGLQGQTVWLVFNNAAAGSATTMADGSLQFKAVASLVVPLGPARLAVRFDGTDILDAQQNVSPIAVYGMPQVSIDGPSTVDSGKDYRYTVMLLDDGSIPLTNRPIEIKVSGAVEGHYSVVTDASGRAAFTVKATGNEVQINAIFMGDGYLLPASGVKVVGVTIWGLLEAIGAIMVIIVVIMVIVNYMSGRRELRAAEEAVARARGGTAGDRYRRAIYRTYRSMSRLFERRGVGRDVAVTVREYETEVSKELPVDGDALGTVTGVFEEARYSDHVLAQGHVNLARKGLNRIDSDLRSTVEDVKATGPSRK
jgi:transglutaminase-like putative cysteine protease